jgi:hypothetical protein
VSGAVVRNVVTEAPRASFKSLQETALRPTTARLIVMTYCTHANHTAPPTNLGCEVGPWRRWRRNRTFWTIISFNNAFSNAGDYVRSRLNTGELKPQYSNRLRSWANVSDPKKTAWHSRDQAVESPYFQQIFTARTHCPVDAQTSSARIALPCDRRYFDDGCRFINRIQDSIEDAP